MQAALEHPFGIYFGMPADEYHADTALSASGIKQLMISPLDYWVTSWMNPDREIVEETESQALGTAVHKRILEGAESFNDAYAIQPLKKNFPNAVDGANALKGMCRNLGLKVGGTIPELCARILGANPEAILWPDIIAQFEERSAGKIIMSSKEGKIVNRIVNALHDDEETRMAFSGGFPEVSVFWPDAVTGVRMKARYDYMKSVGIIDLKLFTNVKRRELLRAIVEYFGTYNLRVQAVVYLQSAIAARILIHKGLVYGVPSDHPILKSFLRNEMVRFFFVFAETGAASNVVVREFVANPKNPSNLYSAAAKIVSEKIALYQSLRGQFGSNRWNIKHKTRPFLDEEVPNWMQ